MSDLIRVGRESKERAEELQIRAHPSSPELGLGLGRAGLDLGQGRAGLGLGNYDMPLLHQARMTNSS